MLKKTGKGFLVILVLLFGVALLKFKFLGKRLDLASIQPYLTQSLEDKDNLRLTYLGCAGFILERNGQSILCDPYISNPGLLEFGKMHTAWKEKVPENVLKSINIMTISHGHYDHCYDIEGLCQYLQQNTKIIGDVSVHYQLDAIYKHTAIKKTALHYSEKQDWHYNTDSSIRVFPLQSTHSPHIGKIEFFKGKYTAPLAELPNRAWQWKKGEAYSYLIDFLNKDQTISHRITLVNGDMNASSVKLLKQFCSERKTDYQLQIFWKEALVTENMLQVYAAAQPKEIILHHWNNFFVSFDKPLEYLRDAHLPQVLEKYNKDNIKMSMMLPFSTVSL